MSRRSFKGVVISSKVDKTLRVSVERRFLHAVCKKNIRLKRAYAVHDAENRCKVGDAVLIQECAPHSKTKAFEVVSIL